VCLPFPTFKVGLGGAGSKRRPSPQHADAFNPLMMSENLWRSSSHPVRELTTVAQLDGIILTLVCAFNARLAQGIIYSCENAVSNRTTLETFSGLVFQAFLALVHGQNQL
jgi:hypothetical protein